MQRSIELNGTSASRDQVCFMFMPAPYDDYKVILLFRLT